MLKLNDVYKIYKMPDGSELEALSNVNLEFNTGEIIAVLGPSGSGKSTLLNMMSGIDSSTSGEIYLDDDKIDNYSDEKFRRLRNKKIGFVFQRFNLIEHLTIIENVTLPLLLTGTDKKIANEMAMQLLGDVNLAEFANKEVKLLSGGQMQRVAIARTLIMNPTILLADEPTGALDSSSAIAVMELIKSVAKNRIVILVTHDEKLAYENATRVIRLNDGKVVSDEQIGKLKDVADISNKGKGVDFKITEGNYTLFKKHFPEQSGEINVGQRFSANLNTKYKKKSKFTATIAKKNYKQNRSINRMIILSLTITLALLLSINILLRNIADYNLNKFNVNNNFYQYEVTNSADKNATISTLNSMSEISEAGNYFEHYVFGNELYYIDQSDNMKSLTTVTTQNEGVNTPKIVTLPSKEENFYLNNQFEVGGFPKTANEVVVSSEFLYVRFFGFSSLKDENTKNRYDKSTLPELSTFVGSSLYICAENVPGGTKANVKAENECKKYTISGVLNSYYKNVNFVGSIFMKEEGFYNDPVGVYDSTTHGYVQKLDDLGFINPENYYDHSVFFYLKDFQDGEYDITSLSKTLNADVENAKLLDYKQMLTLEKLLDYIFIIIYASLIILSGTINYNIVSASVDRRIREIGVYSCIGVSKKNLRKMFINETTMLVKKLLFYTVLVVGAIFAAFTFLYERFVVNLSGLTQEFGTNALKSYQLIFTGATIGVTVLLIYLFVLIPSYRAANLKAIDALKS